jgi:two-component system nitrate/nitrite sensor histidine kinase NarX
MITPPIKNNPWQVCLKLFLRLFSRPKAFPTQDNHSEQPGNANQSLADLANIEQLHLTLAHLLEDPDSTAPFIKLLERLESLTGATASAILINTDIKGKLTPLAMTPSRNSSPSTMTDLNQDGLFEAWDEEDSRIELIPIRKELEEYGLLALKLPSTIKLPDSAIASLRTLGSHLAPIIYSSRRAQSNRRLALYAERAVIARELHDSLAQSLSYLNLQSSRLLSLLKDDNEVPTLDLPAVNSVAQNLRSTISSANYQLREIITTFRITMNGKSFDQALEDSVNELAKRSGIVFDLDYRLPSDSLSVDEEMHVLQIVREALSNVVRHSHAKHATIILHHQDDGRIRLTIDDNGTHSTPSDRQDKHHGLVIMQERARKIGGDFSVEKSPHGGTRVLLSFVSANNQ